MTRYFILLVLLWVPTALLAQANAIVFDHYGLKEGFNSREARSIAIGKNGMVWVSSSDGLVRYDSKTFRFYQHDPKDSTSISSNYCSALATDRRGWVWVCNDGYLDVFKPEAERFTHIAPPSSKVKLQRVYPNALYYELAADRMWVATKRGLYCSKAGSSQLSKVDDFTSDSTLLNGDIATITAGEAHTLWLSCNNIIFKLNTQLVTTERINIPPVINGIQNYQNGPGVVCSYYDKQHVLWLGTWLRGLVGYNTESHRFQQYVYSDYLKEENSVTSISQTAQPQEQNLLFVSTVGKGLCTFNVITGQFNSFKTTGNSDQFGINADSYGLCSDGLDRLWIGSQNGLFQYDLNKQLFKTIDLSSLATKQYLLPVESIAVEKSQSGKDEKIWFYIPYKGAFIYDLPQRQTTAVPTAVVKYFHPETELLDFYIDRKNILWVSTVDYGLVGYAINSNKIITSEKQFFFEPSRQVNEFLEDRQGNLWLGTFNGLYIMDSSRKTAVPVSIVNDLLKQKAAATTIQGLCQANDGAIWFTADNTNKRQAAIGRFNLATNQASLVIDESAHPLFTHHRLNLRDIFVNDAGRVFVVDFSNGLLSFDSKDNQPALGWITTQQGLVSNYVGQFVSDEYGNIWCSTSFGVSCYKQRTQSFINYSFERYAMGSNDLPVLCLSAASGIIYTGQRNGITYFDTKLSITSARKSPLVFTAFKIMNTGLLAPNDQLLSGGKWVLPHDQNYISIEFALLSYSNSLENTYRWKLEGVDRDWIVSKQNVATYANLPPGTYRLEVLAEGNSAEWSEPLLLTIQVKSPFYKTGWFILLCAAALIGLIYVLVRLRINRLKEKYALRNRIATDLHDEIGSTITSINILSNVSQLAVEKAPGKAKEMMEQIAAQSKQIQQNMSDIVWSIRPDNEKMEDLLVRMKEYTAQTLEPLQVKTSFHMNDTYADSHLALQFRKEVLLIFKEAINNIAKHAHATEVNISIHQTKSKLHLSIADNGQWAGNGNSSGTGTRSMKQRAESIGGTLQIQTDQPGTMVTLQVAFT